MADDFDRALEARLAVIEDPDYVDPARADLPAMDLVLLGIAAVVAIVLMIVWSYPA